MLALVPSLKFLESVIAARELMDEREEAFSTIADGGQVVSQLCLSVLWAYLLCSC